jgi:hypothetical protein
MIRFSVHGFSLPVLFAAAAALSLTACIHSEDHKEEETPWEHACVHAGDAPTSTVASADTALAPLVGNAHTLYKVRFASGAQVRLSFDEHAELGLFLSKTVPVTLRTASGDTIDFEETMSPLAGCPDLAVMHVADVDAGVHFLIFGASTDTTVNLLVEELEHHDH